MVQAHYLCLRRAVLTSNMVREAIRCDSAQGAQRNLYNTLRGIENGCKLYWARW